jgi:hypothetical protein
MTPILLHHLSLSLFFYHLSLLFLLPSHFMSWFIYYFQNTYSRVIVHDLAVSLCPDHCCVVCTPTVANPLLFFLTIACRRQFFSSYFFITDKKSVMKFRLTHHGWSDEISGHLSGHPGKDSIIYPFDLFIFLVPDLVVGVCPALHTCMCKSLSFLT